MITKFDSVRAFILADSLLAMLLLSSAYCVLAPLQQQASRQVLFAREQAIVHLCLRNQILLQQAKIDTPIACLPAPISPWKIEVKAGQHCLHWLTPIEHHQVITCTDNQP